MRADNSAHLIAAARQRAETTRARALHALRRLDNAGTAITFQTLAREAGVSRSWLYAQADLRAEIEALRTTERPTPATPLRQRASQASLLSRLEAASTRLRQLQDDNQQLREALAQALGDARTGRVTGTRTSRDTPGRQDAKLIGPC